MQRFHAPVLRLVAWASVVLVACGEDASVPSGTAKNAASPSSSPTSTAAIELASVPAPADNPITAEKIDLGRLLFWDPILSGDRDVACASCHDPAYGYGDGLPISIGTGGRKAKRAALPVLDAAWNGWTDLAKVPDPATAPMFWDLRARSLESQAKGPITGESEMCGEAFDETTIFPELVKRLETIPDYVTKFQAAFGTATIDETVIVRAIATFERTIVSVPSYERWLAGDENAMSDAAKRGVQAFRRDGCSGCHSGPMLSDYQLHRFTRGGEAIRTPSLRNVTKTAPYMHDGRATTLDDVFAIYRRVDHGADPLFQNVRAPDRDDRDAVLAFFAATSDGDFDRSIPTSVPSGLAVGGRRR